MRAKGVGSQAGEVLMLGETAFVAIVAGAYVGLAIYALVMWISGMKQPRGFIGEVWEVILVPFQAVERVLSRWNL